LSLTERQKQLIVDIDQRVNRILKNGGGDEELLTSLFDVMSDLKEIITSAAKNNLDAYCQKYDGFYHYMKLLEKLAAGISNGTIAVPQ
jgi:hypothetical protein